MTERKPIPAKLLQRIKTVTNKRARIVLDAIVKNGSISTVELKDMGYEHPPRARQDAVDLGFAIARVKAKRDDGRAIAAYVFDERELNPNLTGRVVLAKKERDAIIERKDSKCNLCGAVHNIQVDHRIPFQVAGESRRDEADPYQLLDGACNRKKSWSCEHCQNWQKLKSFDTCLSCYWANPDTYAHVAMQPERRVDLVWKGEEVNAFERLKRVADMNKRSVADEIKTMIAS